MNLMDMLESVGGTGSVSKLSTQLGLDGADTSKLVAALAPALVRGMQKQTESATGRDAFTRAIEQGNHKKYIDDPVLIDTEETRMDGDRILGHLFGSKDVSRNVAANAAQSTGIDASLFKKALPIIAGLAMGALSKKGQTSSQGFDIGALGLDDDGFGLDDVLNLAKKFF